MQSHPKRLEKLREKRRWTWAQLADALDLSVSMLMMVRRGDRDLSSRAALRLLDAEVEAGLVQPEGPVTTARGLPLSPDRISELHGFAATIAKMRGNIDSVTAQLVAMDKALNEYLRKANPGGAGGLPIERIELLEPRETLVVHYGTPRKNDAQLNDQPSSGEASSTALTEGKKRALAKAGAMAAGVNPSAGTPPSDSTASTSEKTSEPFPPAPPDHSRESSAPASVLASRESRGSVVVGLSRPDSLGGSRRKSSVPGKTSAGDQ